MIIIIIILFVETTQQAMKNLTLTPTKLDYA